MKPPREFAYDVVVDAAAEDEFREALAEIPDEYTEMDWARLRKYLRKLREQGWI